jgi:hypothetical protein
MPIRKLLQPLSLWLLKPALLVALSLALTGLGLAHGMSVAEQLAIQNGGLWTYFRLGAGHMLTGYDHLLFLLGVVFFLDSLWEIVKYVTAFTLGHSLTLTLATFYHITASAHAVDAVIAGSVCYKAFDNLDLFQSYLKIRRPNLLAVVWVFGLIHGFGLATSLQELPLGQTGLLPRILAFNCGVEVGQLVALVVMVLLLRHCRKSAGFPHFARICNHLLLLAGFLLFLLQTHAYLHSAYPEDFGFPHEHPPSSIGEEPHHDNL